jgi:hypothetical protein
MLGVISLCVLNFLSILEYVCICSFYSCAHEDTDIHISCPVEHCSFIKNIPYSVLHIILCIVCWYFVFLKICVTVFFFAHFYKQHQEHSVFGTAYNLVYCVLVLCLP